MRCQTRNEEALHNLGDGHEQSQRSTADSNIIRSVYSYLKGTTYHRASLVLLFAMPASIPHMYVFWSGPVPLEYEGSGDLSKVEELLHERLAQDKREEAHLLQKNQELLETGEYSDIVINCGKLTINAHKVIVCRECPFFKASLNSGFKVRTPALLYTPFGNTRRRRQLRVSSTYQTTSLSPSSI